jgi:hypothetical protein
MYVDTGVQTDEDLILAIPAVAALVASNPRQTRLRNLAHADDFEKKLPEYFYIRQEVSSSTPLPTPTTKTPGGLEPSATLCKRPNATNINSPTPALNILNNSQHPLHNHIRPPRSPLRHPAPPLPNPQPRTLPDLSPPNLQAHLQRATPPPPNPQPNLRQIRRAPATPRLRRPRPPLATEPDLSTPPPSLRALPDRAPLPAR